LNNGNRPFLKWAGGKYKQAPRIIEKLQKGDRLVEPFCGACAVFLNSNFNSYLLNDINPDLINLFNILKANATAFIDSARPYFLGEFNNKEAYYKQRLLFNKSNDPYFRAVLFLYLNRHCFNGLCRYNKSGGFNVPFGKYDKPYFPEIELQIFSQKAQNAVFSCKPYQQIFNELKAGDVVYCDPPFAPRSKTANFVNYSAGGFDKFEHLALAALAQQSKNQILISNNFTDFTKNMYRNAQLDIFWLIKSIGANGTSRIPQPEIMALFPAPSL
jgi:DNA adenine methylase